MTSLALFEWEQNPFDKHRNYKTIRKSKNKPFSPSSWWKHCREYPWTHEQTSIYNLVVNTKQNILIQATAGSGKSTTLKAICAAIPENLKAGIYAFNKHIAEQLSDSGIFTENQSVGTLHGLGYSLLIRQNSGSSLHVKQDKVHKLVAIEVDKLLDPQNNGDDSVYLKYLSPDEHDRIKKLLDAIAPKNSDSESKKTNRVNRKDLIDWQKKLIGGCKKTLVEPSYENLIKLVSNYQIKLTLSSLNNEMRGLLEILEKAMLLAVPEILSNSNNLYLRNKIIDFDDMTYLPHFLGLPVTYKDMILADEVQDLNPAQISLLAKYHKLGTRIIGVGDPRQSIYGFQFALPNCWEMLKTQFNMTEINMSYTFRCPKEVVSYIINRGYHDNFVAFPSNKQGSVYHIGERGLIWQLQANDLVVSRFNAPLMRLCVSLYLHNQPAKIRGKDELYEQLIGMLSPYFKSVIDWPYDGYDLWLEDTNNLITELKHDGLDSQAELLGDKAECIKICYTELASKCETFSAFADAIKNLFSDDKGDGYVILSTIHRAKGDEAERVFVIGYPRLPYKRKNMQSWQCEQENNLIYVALSRAKSELYLIDSDLSHLEKSLIEDTEITEIDYVEVEQVKPNLNAAPLRFELPAQ